MQGQGWIGQLHMHVAQFREFLEDDTGTMRDESDFLKNDIMPCGFALLEEIANGIDQLKPLLRSEKIAVA